MNTRQAVGWGALFGLLVAAVTAFVGVGASPDRVEWSGWFAAALVAGVITLVLGLRFVLAKDKGDDDSAAVNAPGVGSDGIAVGVVKAGRDVTITKESTTEAEEPVTKVFELRVPDRLKPGKIYNHTTRYLEDLWIGKYTTESRVLIFHLEVPGYNFMDAWEFQAVFQTYPDLAKKYFSNPLDVSWPNRQLNLAFVIKSEGEDDSSFVLLVQDRASEHEYRLEPGGLWACLSDGSVRLVE